MGISHQWKFNEQTTRDYVKENISKSGELEAKILKVGWYKEMEVDVICKF